MAAIGGNQGREAIQIVVAARELDGFRDDD
ncbi:MAG: hypothetical protein JWP21_1570 [Tardiphaga sp.]|nr:hypothetical protein [Tardiphaga sp.]